MIPADDEALLARLGYKQELRRGMGGFSNFALSFSIICILAGGVTSFHLGLCGSGGVSIGLGWPLVCLFVLAVSLTMAQVASAFPTAGGLYHWASILGGKGWGYGVAWLNLAGLVTALAAIDVGGWTFGVHALGLEPWLAANPGLKLAIQGGGVCLILASQALVNERGIRITTIITDLTGYLILTTAIVLSISMLVFADRLEWSRLWTFTNLSGSAGGNVWPRNENLGRLFALGFLLPAYTLTGFDASAHVAEETIDAARSVPLGLVRSVAVASVFGWLMLIAVVVALPDLREAAEHGEGAFVWSVRAVLPVWLWVSLAVGIVVSIYCCGLGALTSASRMAYAFARDGGLPGSSLIAKVGEGRRTPGFAIGGCALGAWLFTIWTPVYATISVVCTLFLYISYVVPTALGAWSYGRGWTRMGPWQMGVWYRPLAVLSVLGCGLLVAIGLEPPHARSAWVLAGVLVVLVVAWFGGVRRRFAGPPRIETLEDACRPGGVD